jgi:hypothetical protein
MIDKLREKLGLNEVPEIKIELEAFYIKDYNIKISYADVVLARGRIISEEDNEYIIDEYIDKERNDNPLCLFALSEHNMRVTENFKDTFNCHFQLFVDDKVWGALRTNFRNKLRDKADRVFNGDLEPMFVVIKKVESALGWKDKENEDFETFRKNQLYTVFRHEAELKKVNEEQANEISKLNKRINNLHYGISSLSEKSLIKLISKAQLVSLLNFKKDSTCKGIEVNLDFESPNIIVRLTIRHIDNGPPDPDGFPRTDFINYTYYSIKKNGDIESERKTAFRIFDMEKPEYIRFMEIEALHFFPFTLD